MPELLVDFITSLDGYGEAEGRPGWWGLEAPEYHAWLRDQPEAGYVVLMGARTYRLISGCAAEGEPGTESLAQLDKVVFSSSLVEPLPWPNTRLVSRDPVEAVREMKATGDRSLRTIGSLTLCRSLLEARLVDRFRVVVFPVITGSTGQERIYDAYPDVSLEMVNSRTFDGRLQLLECVPSVLDSPPGVATMLERLRDATNAHDAGRLASLFAEDYRSAQPLHPSRGFGSSAQVLENWSSVFEGVPDFTSQLIASAVDGDVQWGEWNWQGHHVGRFTLRDAWGHHPCRARRARRRGTLVHEPVEAGGEDIGASVQQLYRPPSGSS